MLLSVEGQMHFVSTSHPENEFISELKTINFRTNTTRGMAFSRRSKKKTDAVSVGETRCKNVTKLNISLKTLQKYDKVKKVLKLYKNVAKLKISLKM